MSVNIGLLKTTPFRLLDKWYVEKYINARLLNSDFKMVKVAELMSPVKRRMKKDTYDGNLPIVSKIVFKTGEVVFRKENKTGMDLLHVIHGDLLVSSINFHQGAVALNTIGDFVCSTHYQTFIIDETRIIPAFLLKVLRSDTFINMVAGIKANGIKNESGFDFIGGFEIPLPSIPEQEQILKAYHATIEEAEKSISDGDDFSTGLLFDIQSTVSDLKEQDVSTAAASPILQIISYSSVSRWEVAFGLKGSKLDKVYNSFKYPIYTIAELTKESLFGLSIKASPTQEVGMIPMLRMSNIVNGELDLDDLKYLPRKTATTAREPDKWLLRKGDFLINRTNSKELVGKSAVFNLDGDYTYASYVIRYRFDTSIVLPEYVNILFMLPLVRFQIDTMSRQTAGQCNINSDEIGSIRIPVPSISEQAEIIKKYYSTKAGADKFYTKAEELRKKAYTDFEQTIFA